MDSGSPSAVASRASESRAASQGGGDGAHRSTRPRRVQFASGVGWSAGGASDDSDEERQDSGSDQENSTAKGHKGKVAKYPLATKRPGEAGINMRDGIDASREPLNSLDDIFEKLTDTALHLGFDAAIRDLDGRSIKIATMCSGTESPILASRFIADVCSQRELRFAFEHLFSAEIVPFKQAFIERNFSPPVIFRNIQDLKKGFKAETAYGAPASLPEPGQVHLLVAGFACVDFSNLNPNQRALDLSPDDVTDPVESDKATDRVVTSSMKLKRRGIGKQVDPIKDAEIEGVENVRQEGGESSATFRAIATYARDYRPPLIILENIKNAPWVQISEVFERIGYSAGYVIVDTKTYYIPHTRQRGYMLCVDREGERQLGKTGADYMVEQWGFSMGALQRPASSSVEEFMLPESSPIVQTALKEFELSDATGEPIKRETDWSVCQGRHSRYRAEKNVGEETPYTKWSHGKSSMPSYASIPWGKLQPNRVKDTLDILKLTNAAQGVDFEFKSRFPDLSQNVDRGLDSAPAGITGCITPSGGIYSSLRGRPLIGQEALLLQGLPHQRLHLTRETQRELKDLAGNAMTSTVVGAAILGAMIVARDAIPQSWLGPKRVPSSSDIDTIDGDVVDINLVRVPLEFGPKKPSTVLSLCDLAKSTAQLCNCEGQYSITSAPIYICKKCSTTACKHCNYIPTHEFEEMNPETLIRIDPKRFVRMIHDCLPTRLTLSLKAEDFERAKSDFMKSTRNANVTTEMPEWKAFLDAVQHGLGDEVRLHSITRGTFWTVTYMAPHQRLELVLKARSAQWRLFIEPRASEPRNASIRRLLRLPIARMHSARDAVTVTTGRWDICLPVVREGTLNLVGCGSLVPSWKDELGLEGLKAEDRQVWNQFKIEADEGENDHDMEEIAGVYELLNLCGMANRSLHVRKTTNKLKTSGHECLYLFLDPENIGPGDDDEFVVSSDTRRLTSGEARDTKVRIGSVVNDGKVGSKWRPSARNQETVKYMQVGHWTPTDAILDIAVDTESQFLIPRTDLREVTCYFTSRPTCRNSNVTIFQCCIPWYGPNPDGKPYGSVCMVTETNQEHMMLDLLWLSYRIPDFSHSPEDWTPALLTDLASPCPECAPQRPSTKWVEEPVKPKRSSRAKEKQNLTSASGKNDDANKRPSKRRKSSKSSTSGDYKEGMLNLGASAPRSDEILEAATREAGLESSEDSGPTVLIPYEDPAEAAPYERAVKNIPSSITIGVQVAKGLQQNMSNVTISINPTSLLHRAMSIFLADKIETNVQIQGFWRLKRYDSTSSKLATPFSLLSNKHDDPHPFEFELTGSDNEPRQRLRIEQARSLAWMILMDGINVPPFKEEVMEEAISTHLQWRLEARALRSRQIRGGIVADDVGFGKTVTMIALMSHTMPQAKKEARSSACGLIPLKATCVFVPHTLAPQWKDEIEKFWPSCKLLSFSTVAALRKATIAQFQDADVVLVSVGLLLNPEYERRLAEIAALPEPPPLKGQREHEAWLSRGTERLEDFTRKLRGRPFPTDFDKYLRQAIDEFECDEVLHSIIPSRRRRGKDFIASLHREAQAQEARPHKDPSFREKLSRRGDGIVGFEDVEDIRSVRFPVLHMFRFHRKVVDEQTYVEPLQSQSIRLLKSVVSWILSGTPHLRDVIDIQRMASYLGASLAVVDDTPGYCAEENIKALQKTRTDFEKFESFKSSHSAEWHLFRHAKAQEFLNVFARKNKPEYGEIDSDDILYPVTLSPIHRILYMELQSQLLSEDAKISNKDIKGELSHDSGRRLMNVLRSSKDVHEGILKNATVLDIGSPANNQGPALRKGSSVSSHTKKRQKQADKAASDIVDAPDDQLALDNKTARPSEALDDGFLFDSILRARSADQDRLRASVLESLDKIVAKVEVCSASVQERFERWLDRVNTQKHGDFEATEILQSLLRMKDHDIARILSTIHGGNSGKRTRASAKPSSSVERSTRQEIDKISERSVALTSSLRAKRYLIAANRIQCELANIQENNLNVATTRLEVNCECETASTTSIYLNRDCGHIFCISCFNARKSTAFCPVSGCKGRVLSINLITPNELESKENPTIVHENSKVTDIVDLVASTHTDDQAILFVQFDDIAAEFTAAFAKKNIRTSHARNTMAAQTIMKTFRTRQPGHPDWVKVLILNPLDSSAAGHNLTNASHVIFVSPILTSSQEVYVAAYRQAIGRSLRFGQNKTVQIHHYLTLRSMDVSLHEKHSGGEKLVLQGNRLYSVPREQAESLGEDWAPRAMLSRYLE